MYYIYEDSIIKILVVPKLIYKFSVIPSKMPEGQRINYSEENRLK